LVESYDGSTFTEVGDLNSGRMYGMTAGTQPAGLYFGGYSSPPATSYANTESWNGSAWSEVNDLNTARHALAGGGSQTSAIAVDGNNQNGQTETWNGSSWTEVNDLNTGRTAFSGGAADNTNAIVFAGNLPGFTTKTEQWNGSSWTEVNDLNTAREGPCKGGGTYTDVLCIAGSTPPGTTKTESWNGTSWTEVADLAVARENAASAMAGGPAAVVLGGGAPSYAIAEEFTAPAVFNKQVEGQLYFNSTTNTFKETITDIPGATWASGGDVNTARYGIAASGDASNGLIAGGNDNGSPGYKNETEVYNGTSWTEVNNLNQERGVFGASNSSPYTDSVAFGGYTGTANTGHTETWNGSSWTTSPASLNTARRYNGGLGAVSTNALCCGGKTSPSYPGPGHTAVESWNGSSWTEVAEFSTGRNESPVGAGTNTAAIIYGGQYPPGLNVRANTESFDGTSWTELNDLNTARGYMGGGTQTIALAYGGRASPGALANTEAWNGTSWSEVNDISTARAEAGGSSNTGTSSALFSSGSAGPPSLPSATEEWTADLANKTITAS
jgi:hypothetical protein